LCKEQQHSQKQDFFVIMVWLKLLRVFKLAGLTACIFLGLGLMAFGRYGLSIEEVDDYNNYRRAQSKGVQRGWQMNYGGEFWERW
jgi:hypothetical protein